MVWLVGRFIADNLFAGFFAKNSSQMDGKVGVFFPLRVVHLMCARCVSVRRIYIKGSSKRKTGGETYSKVKYLFSESAVGWRVRGGLCSTRVALQ